MEAEHHRVFRVTDGGRNRKDELSDGPLDHCAHGAPDSAGLRRTTSRLARRLARRSLALTMRSYAVKTRNNARDPMPYDGSFSMRLIRSTFSPTLAAHRRTTDLEFSA